VPDAVVGRDAEHFEPAVGVAGHAKLAQTVDG
jgi:hypothetical protein